MQDERAVSVGNAQQADGRQQTIAALRAQISVLEADAGVSVGPQDNRGAASAAPAAVPPNPFGGENCPAEVGKGRHPLSDGPVAYGRDGAGDKDDHPADPDAKAYERIIVLCSYRDFSREKMRRRLAREKVDQAAADAALDRAVACGLIDDVRYGEALAAGRMRAGKGRFGIENELRDNRIDPASLEGWPEEYAARYGDELDRALRILERNPPRSKRPRESAYRRLCTKGYSPEVALQAARVWWDGREKDR